MSAWHEKRAALQKRIHYRFQDETLLAEACFLSGARLSRASAEKDNQRLEFLGDRVLGLVVAEALFASDENLSVGEMAARLNMLVGRDSLKETADAIQLADCLDNGGNLIGPSQCADACEALIAALYQDGGLEAARRFILDFWRPLFLRASQGEPRDAKSLLQEASQQADGALPIYKFHKPRGPRHAPEFRVEVFVKGMGSASGIGLSKRAAEQEAAGALLRKMKEEGA